MTMHADAPTDVPVTPIPLSAAQRHWLEEAVSRIDEYRMRTLHGGRGSPHSTAEGMAKQGKATHAAYRPRSGGARRR